MKTSILVLVLSFLLMVTSAQAQTPPSIVIVSLASARLTWIHDLLNVDSFVVDCGAITHGVIAPTLEAPLIDFITESGEYTCTVRAKNKYGESGPSNSITFDAGNPPNEAADFKLVVP